MRATCNHVHAAVLRAVAHIAGVDPGDRQKPARNPVLIVEAAHSEDWASVTFTGATHAIELRLEGDADRVAAACTALACRIGDQDIPVAGQIVADIAIALSSRDTLPDNMVIQKLTVNLLTILD